MDIIRRNRAFQSLMGNQFVSLIGDILFYPIMLILASQSSNVGLMTGLVTLSETLPKIAVLFIVPKMEKVRNRFYVYCVSSFIRFIIYTLIALMIRQQTDMILFVVIILNAFSDVVGGAVSHTSISYIAAIASEDTNDDDVIQQDFSKMSGFSQVVQSVSQLFGLAAGGVLLSVLFPSQIAFINALTFLFGMFILFFARKSFIHYDNARKIEIEESQHQSSPMRTIFENRRLVWLIFLTGVLNVMLSLMIFFNNMYAKQVDINHSYSTYVFIFFIVCTIGMIIGGLWMSVKPLKVTFDTIAIIIYVLAFVYFIVLYFHISILLLVIAFVIMVAAALAQAVLMGEFIGIVGAEKIAGIAVSLNVLVQLMVPMFIVIVTVFVQCIPLSIVTILMALFFCGLSVAIALKRNFQKV